MKPSSQPLAGCRVLIVEDRYLIAAELAHEVDRMGAEVLGPSATVAAAQEIVAREPLDAALLDVNLEEELAFPLAEALLAKGVPFMFLTGYDSDVLPPEWRDSPRLAKPVNPRLLREELASLCARAH